MAKRYRPSMILVEDTSVGPALRAELRTAGYNVWPIKPTESKLVRAAVQALKFEGGRVYLPKRAPWLDQFEAELFAFPGGRHDDQVDSVVQALAYERPHTVTTTSCYPCW